MPGLQRAVRQPGRRRHARASRTSSAAENLARAAKAAAAIGATVLVEPVSGPKPYPLRTAADVGRRDRPGPGRARNVGLLCDLFHLANNGDDVGRRRSTRVRRPDRPRADRRRPGRGEPGSGDARPRPASSTELAGRRLRRLGRPGVQADHHHRSRASAGCRATRGAADPLSADHPRRRTDMTTIAFIGLGIMGSPMAGHLVKAGSHRRRVQPQSPSRSRRSSRPAASGADSVADAVTDADVIITMVPGLARRRGRRAGRGRHLRQRPPRARSTSTCPRSAPTSPPSWPKPARRPASGCMDAPVSGGEAGAVEAVLSIMVGGEPSDFEEVKPILDDGRQDRRPASVRAAPARPSRRPTS